MKNERGLVACPQRKLLSGSSDAAGRGKPSVDGHDDAGDEARGVAGKPERDADQFIRLAESSHGRMIDDLLSARRQRKVSVFAGRRVHIEQQRSILVTDEEAGRNRIDAQSGPVLLGQIDCQPAGQIGPLPPWPRSSPSPA